jgi:type IV pilus assembly protein PilO
MTYNSDLIESDLVSNTSFISAPTYPSVFGITFSPTIVGLGISAIGLGVSGYLIFTSLQPQLAKNQELETKLSETQNQIQQRKDNAKKIAAAEQSLDKANAQRQVVMGLFASDKKLDTLLLDLNKLVNIRQGELQKFSPDAPVAGGGSSGAAVVTDSSLGAALNGKIKRKGVSIAVKGNFEQVQSILRTIERLDQLLIVKDFKADVDKGNQKMAVDAQGKIIPAPEAAIQTSFKIQAIIPMNSAEQAVSAPPPPPPKK